MQMAVASISLQIDGLVSESYFECPVMVAAEDIFRATVWLNLAVWLDRFPPQSG